MPLAARLLSLALLLFVALGAPARAQAAPEGTVVLDSAHGYQALVERLEAAVAEAKMAVVTRASATVGAKQALDKVIPGNTVIGVYHPRYAVRMLEASIAAGIEAPIRFYVTEEADGTARLRYRRPSALFAPYDDGGAALAALAEELDAVFAGIAEQAVR